MLESNSILVNVPLGCLTLCNQKTLQNLISWTLSPYSASSNILVFTSGIKDVKESLVQNKEFQVLRLFSVLND